jgi:hypothetical protein
MVETPTTEEMTVIAVDLLQLLGLEETLELLMEETLPD